MARLILLAILASANAIDSSDPVRRSNPKDSPSSSHCVVWGDGPYYGMKFTNEEDADQKFKLVKTEEMVAIHYDKRFREVQRFQSPRVKAVRWHHLADWCKEEHEAEAPSKINLEVGVGSAGNVEEFMDQSKSRQASLMADDSAPASVIRTSSNLVGKVGMLEDELAQLASKASTLLASIGAEHVAFQTLGGKNGKLKARVSMLENNLAGMFESAKTLEEEIVGTTGAGLVTSSKEKNSIKAKVDAMVVKVDGLKKRFLALDASPVITQVPELETKVAAYSSKIADMFKDYGFPSSTTPAFIANKNDKMKTRIVSFEAAIADAQRNTNTLGYELLERSWNSPEQSLLASLKGKGIKARVESLMPSVDDLQHRMSELDSASLKSDIGNTEKKLGSLHDKAAELSKRIGTETPSMLETQVPVDTSNLKARLARLEKLVSQADSKFGHLEVELLGSAKVLSESLENTQSMKGKVKSLEVKVDGLSVRAAALEQDV